MNRYYKNNSDHLLMSQAYGYRTLINNLKGKIEQKSDGKALISQ